MSIHSHAVCDQCERKLIPVGDDETVTEEYMIDTGWVSVKWAEIEEEESVELAKDFCSFNCASRWCATATEVVTETGNDDRAGA